MKINNKNNAMYKNSVNTVWIIFSTLTLFPELMVEKNCLSQEQKNLMIAGEGSYKECVIIFLLVLPITVQYLLL